ncbi:4Fe-4S binding protein [Grimontia marina]|uniref:Electron transport complex subunit RsxB n=1 Tax=Grimontia marina TaxID=646534 RepID=A0A128ESX2_9GAMM|nr:Electron transport complex subunit RsxB [Grimontia marina]
MATQTTAIEHMSTENNITTLNQYLENQTDTNGLARLHALRSTVTLGNLIPPTVSFESRGLALVVGNASSLSSFSQLIADDTRDRIVLLCNEAGATLSNPAEGMTLFFSSEVKIDGFLGSFLVTLTHNGALQNLAQIAFGREYFDLIVDLTEKGIHAAQLPPLGYHAVGRGLVTAGDASEAVIETVGTFDKPKFFRLDNERCAHVARGLEGCTRCIDTCPADALSSIEQTITINPYLCQGMGSCATTCPTEAISYALPDPENTQHFVFDLIQRFRQQGGEVPAILFYAEADEDTLVAAMSSLPNNTIPVRLEELASVGLDTWLNALVYGASQVILAMAPNLHAKTRHVLEQELLVASSFLNDLNIEQDRIALKALDTFSSLTQYSNALMTHPEKLTGTKREKLCQALDLLAAQSAQTLTTSLVPQNAPYGRVNVKTDECTLCMGCVAVCPTDALLAIGSHPGMTFREQDCVQCGLCETSCPESVITLEPRYNWDTETRQQRETLHEEEAAKCTSCGKPFAPVSMVNMLIEKLQNHSHFEGDAIKRLSMCEDCRVRDIVAETMINNPEKQMKV